MKVVKVTNKEYVGYIYLIITSIIGTLVMFYLAPLIYNTVGIEFYSDFEQVLIISMVIVAPFIPLGFTLYLALQLYKWYTGVTEFINAEICSFEKTLFFRTSFFLPGIYKLRVKNYENGYHFASYKMKLVEEIPLNKTLKIEMFKNPKSQIKIRSIEFQI